MKKKAWLKKSDKDAGTKKGDLIDLVNSLEESSGGYRKSTAAANKAAQMEYEYDDYITTKYKAKRAEFEKAQKAAAKEVADFKRRLECLKHLILAKGVCAETINESEAMRVLFAKLNFQDALERNCRC